MGFFLGPIGALLTVSTIFPLSVKGFRSFRFTLKKLFKFRYFSEYRGGMYLN